MELFEIYEIDFVKIIIWPLIICEDSMSSGANYLVSGSRSQKSGSMESFIFGEHFRSHL